MRNRRKKKAGTSTVVSAANGTTSPSSEEGSPIPRSAPGKSLAPMSSREAYRVFPNDGLQLGVLDQLTFAITPKKAFADWGAPRVKIHTTADLGLPYDKPFTKPRMSGRRWKPPASFGVSWIEQRFETRWMAGDIAHVGQLVNVNVLRVIRSCYGRCIVDKRDNFVPLSMMSRADLRREVLRCAIAIKDQAVVLYCDIIRTVYGVVLHPDDLDVTVQHIEIAWDVPCRHAMHAVTRYADAWPRNFLASSIHSGIEGRFLMGRMRKGQRYKLYAKAADHLRAEYSPNKKELARTLGGRAMRLTTMEALARDLDIVAADAYDRFLEIQAAIAPVDLRLFALKVASALTDQKRNGAWEKIAPGLLADGTFFNEGSNETCLTVLRTLQLHDMVTHLGRGQWVVPDDVAESLRCVRKALEPLWDWEDDRTVDESLVSARMRGLLRERDRS